MAPGAKANLASGQGLAAVAELPGEIARNVALLVGLLLLIIGIWVLARGSGGGGGGGAGGLAG